VLGNLRNGPIAADQSERFSQPVSQITHSHFRVSHFADYPSPVRDGVRDRVRDRDMSRDRVRLRGLAIAAPSYGRP